VKTKNKWSPLSTARARVLSGRIVTKNPSAFINAPIRQIAANKMFVGFLLPLKRETRVRKVRMKKLKAGKIT
jgi:hypothetical protein